MREDWYMDGCISNQLYPDATFGRHMEGSRYVRIQVHGWILLKDTPVDPCMQIGRKQP